MELMREKAKAAKDPERGWNCKRLSALLRAFLEARCARAQAPLASAAVSANSFNTKGHEGKTK
jgi:hypothetical protein